MRTTTGETTSMLTLEKLLPREKLRGTPHETPTRYASGTLWPHGEWSLGYGKDRPDGGAWHEDPFVGMGVDDVAMAQRASEGRRPLDLSDAPNSHTRAARGLKGITSYGQQMVKAAGWLLQDRYPRHRMTLGTITFPEMSQEARRELVDAWPEIIRQLLQWQSRRLRRLGLPPAIVSVTEIQPGRFAETGQACLHLHQVWLNTPARHGRWSFSPNLVRAYLSRLLMRTVKSYTWGYINVDTRPVEGEAAAYLAKYMSKGKQSISEALEDWGEGCHPRTWWNMTKPMRDAVKAATFKGRSAGRVLELCLDYMWQSGDTEPYAFIRPIEMEFDGCKYLVGWRGRFVPWASASVKSDLEKMATEAC